jgi:Cutinase
MTEGQSCGTCDPDRIVRLAGIHGSLTSWVLPTQRGYPFRIVAGPDGAMWFTESTANRIGRITTAGAISEYRLPSGVTSPAGITVGADKALWFTAGSDLGRITTEGKITVYRVPGASSLLGVYAAPDGSFWLADQTGNKVIHFTPPRSSGPVHNGCAAYGVIDSRGSGEPAGELSPPRAAVAAELRMRHPGLRVADYWNPYPAVGLKNDPRQWLNAIGAGSHIEPLGAYHGSVADGEQWLRQFVPHEAHRCPATKLILVGYSQGAQVTGGVDQRNLTDGVKRHIAATLLFGDPYFNPRDRGADHGNYDHDRSGALGKRPSFARDTKVRSLCHRRDPVCQDVWHGVPEPHLFLTWGFEQHENYPADATKAASGL